MSETTAGDRARSCPDPTHWERCDVLVGLDGVYVLAVDEQQHHLRVVIECKSRVTECRIYGAIAYSHGRREVFLVDVPCLGARSTYCGASGPGAVSSRAALLDRGRNSRTTWPDPSVVDGQGVLVGHLADPPRARLDRRYRPPARHELKHRVAIDRATAASDGRRRGPVHRRRVRGGR
jgi:hypothetical protein